MSKLLWIKLRRPELVALRLMNFKEIKLTMISFNDRTYFVVIIIVFIIVRLAPRTWNQIHYDFYHRALDSFNKHLWNSSPLETSCCSLESGDALNFLISERLLSHRLNIFHHTRARSLESTQRHKHGLRNNKAIYAVSDNFIISAWSAIQTFHSPFPCCCGCCVYVIIFGMMMMMVGCNLEVLSTI